MVLVEFDEDLHSPFIRSWLQARNLTDDLMNNPPSIGLVCFHNEVPIACGFLRQVEGNFGLFDGLCTNPKMRSEIRHDAIDFLVSEIIQIARSMEMRCIFGWTVDNGTLARSERHGFQRLKHEMIVLNFNSDLH
jgi:N-acetylglutamate synthase-like GNAT family acetyltransferase